MSARRSATAERDSRAAYNYLMSVGCQSAQRGDSQEWARTRPRPVRGIVLFDGNCELCARAIRFLIRRDPQGQLAYAALNSPPARRLLAAHGRPPDQADRVILVEGGRSFERSTAMLRAVARLRWPWPLVVVLLLIPRVLRDAVYDFVSRQRSKWFGRCKTCPDLHQLAPDRFLD